MKLKNIIKCLNTMTHCKVFIAEDGFDEPYFEGSIMDIPWCLLDYYLDNDSFGEAIEAYKDDNDYGFGIYLRETKESNCKRVI